MSISFAGWLGDTDPLVGTPSDHEQSRAAAAWRRILDKPAYGDDGVLGIAFLKPNGTTLSRQVVRLEWDNSASDSESAAGQAPVRKLIIFGIKGHSSLSDTDMEEGYRFILGNDELRCVDVIETIGERQGIFEATG